jgi:hypothetical protein
MGALRQSMPDSRQLPYANTPFRRIVPRSERVLLVMCSASKNRLPCLAKDMYESPRFQADRARGEREYHSWFILSGLYGLLAPSAEIVPYNFNLNQASKLVRLAWRSKLSGQFAAQLAKPPVGSVTLRAQGAYLELASEALGSVGFGRPRVTGEDPYGPFLEFERNVTLGGSCDRE